jgi:hypothetical protein
MSGQVDVIAESRRWFQHDVPARLARGNEAGAGKANMPCCPEAGGPIGTLGGWQSGPQSQACPKSGGVVGLDALVRKG